jgi:6-phosphogluconate dehydrogenase
MNNLAIIGLATMGANLAKNFASRGKSVAVFNRSYGRTEVLVSQDIAGIVGYQNLEECIASLESPRVVVVLVQAGAAVDQTIEHLLPLLSPNDIIIEMGNSHYSDTIRRQSTCSAKQISLIGCGISGGEEGALHGPSLMPGGNKNALDIVMPLLELVAATDYAGKPCVTQVGIGAAGHFVKMVHNGIEYAMMQGIAELYDLMKLVGVDYKTQIELFRSANTKQNQSYLLDITVDILSRSNNGQPFVQQIVDRAGAKGTGKWAVAAAMDLGVAVPSIAGAVMARIASARTNTLKPQPTDLRFDDDHRKIAFVDPEAVWHTLHAIFFYSYLQGLELIIAANNENNWDINISEVLRIWQGGCIIRSHILEQLESVLDNPTKLQLLCVDTYEELGGALHVWSHAQGDLPRPVLHASYDYAVTLLSSTLPTNLIQAQRDYFGAHGYEQKNQSGVWSGGWYASRPMTQLEL